MHKAGGKLLGDSLGYFKESFHLGGRTHAYAVGLITCFELRDFCKLFIYPCGGSNLEFPI